jgi:hypothetical protein
MTTSYPGSLDSFVNPTSTDTLSSSTVPHAAQHDNANDAIAAVESTLGVNPQGSYSTVAARLAASTGSIVTAKGDLLAATGASTITNLPVGADGTTLVANSSASTGVSWAGPTFTAGKNKIINGDFGIWQRGTSFTGISAGIYTADRWVTGQDGTGTATVSRQSFTPGAAPVAGYEGSFFLRHQVAAIGTTTFFQMLQAIEDVRTLAGQTVTISFWAKSDSAKTGLVYGDQNFGSGGSSTVQLTVNSVSFTTSWQRFTYTISLPSVSGKTIGTSSFLAFYIRNGATSVGSQLDIWGIQVEAGSVATPFTTATGTLSGELAACQRYYTKSYSQATAPGTASTTTGATNYMVYSTTSTNNRNSIKLPVTMRTSPTITLYSSNSGTAAKIYNESQAVDVDGVAYYVGEQGFNYYLNSGSPAVGNVTLVQYAASAEL